jgi:glycosyltransferase involved in cell wall biosynthesis
VLHPPVDTAFFTPGAAPPASNFLVVSALVPYKRVEVAITAAARLGAQLTIVGTGPDLSRLRALAGPTVEFAGVLGPTDLREAYRRAQALLLPAEEDFGISPVEAMACGRPVIALRRGGTLETVIDGTTGLLVDEATPDAFADAMRTLRGMTFDAQLLADHASQFGVERFEREFQALAAETMTLATAC